MRRATELHAAQRAGGPAPRELFRFRPGTRAPQSGDPVLPVPLRPADGDVLDEAWHAASPGKPRRDGPLTVIPGGDRLALHYMAACQSGAAFRTQVSEASARLVTVAREAGFERMLRAWNFFPGINSGAGDSERYRQFALGRGEAFDAMGITTQDLPATTVIGAADGAPLCITMLFTRHALTAVENPRQVSAYQYPREYGPRSPSFARSVLLDDGARKRLYISGTASIVGHASQHPGDPRAQVEEISRNVQSLVERALPLAGAASARPAQRGWRAYLRNPADAPAVRAALSDAFGGEYRFTLLAGEICRRELLVEIEGALDLVVPASS